MKKLICLLLCLLLFAAPLTVRAAQAEPPEPIATTEPSTEPTQPEGIHPLSEEPIQGGEEVH